MRSTSTLRPFVMSTLLAVGGAGCAPADDGGPDGGVGGEGEGEGEGEAVVAEPTLTTARARAVGRLADRVRIDVSGVDLQDDSAGLQLRLLSENGAELAYFDSDFDGRVDSASSVVPFDAAAVVGVEHAFTAVVTLLEAPEVPRELASIEVSIVDALGNVSASRSIAVVLPPEVGEGVACDVAFVDSRCGDGLGCKGTPAVCAPPEAPVLTRLAYLLPDNVDVAGPRLLAEGVDADQDVVMLHLEFMDDAGAPVTLDLDGDDVGDASTFDLAVDDNDGAAAFHAVHEMGMFLQDEVVQIAATPEDGGGRLGERVVTRIAAPATRSPGQACSALGFDVCRAGSVCSATATSTATTCQATTTLRASECRDAAVVDIGGAGSFDVVGVVAGPSIWEVPVGCSPNDPVGRPETVVQLRVTSDMAKLTITTDTPQTGFDTVMYVLSSCAADGDEALVCGDDGEQSVASTVTLTGVAAGTYSVVIDSFGPAGGSFGLAVTAE